MSPRDKAILDRIYDKHYGPNAKRLRRDRKAEKVEKALKDKKVAKSSRQEAPVQEITAGVGIVDQPKLGTRAELMQQAQQRGIKYFRILTKDELVEVLSQTDKNYINGIIENAKKRWQAGWQKNKQAKPEPVLVAQ